MKVFVLFFIIEINYAFIHHFANIHIIKPPLIRRDILSFSFPTNLVNSRPSKLFVSSPAVRSQPFQLAQYDLIQNLHHLVSGFENDSLSLSQFSDKLSSCVCSNPQVLSLFTSTKYRYVERIFKKIESLLSFSPASHGKKEEEREKEDDTLETKMSVILRIFADLGFSFEQHHNSYSYNTKFKRTVYRLIDKLLSLPKGKTQISSIALNNILKELHRLHYRIEDLNIIKIQALVSLLSFIKEEEKEKEKEKESEKSSSFVLVLLQLSNIGLRYQMIRSEQQFILIELIKRYLFTKKEHSDVS
jgi:hypothetical protein